MAKGIKRRITSALKKIDGEIAGLASNGRYAAAMSSEGYVGGYRQALYDVLALIDGGYEPDTRGYWDREPSNVELRGDAPLHGAASLSNAGLAGAEDEK